jgi:hypothetical protein
MAKNQLNLPADYLKWLDGLGRNSYVLFDDREWELAGRKELTKTVNVDGRKAAYVEQTKLYAKSLAEATGETATIDDEGNEFRFSRLAKCLAIGCDNEDVLCLDPSDKYSVWCFHAGDGGDMEKIAGSLSVWLRKAKVQKDE